MSSCNHENVVSYHTSFVYKEELWLILRLLDAGSLLDIVRHKMKTQDCRSGVLDEVSILDLELKCIIVTFFFLRFDSTEQIILSIFR